MKNFGFIYSDITDKTPRFSGSKSLMLPVRYSYEKFLPPVGNQGDRPYCVPCSLSAWLNWKVNMKTGSSKDNGIDCSLIYESKTNHSEGMQYQDAFNFLKNKGIKCGMNMVKISEAGIVPNENLLKPAILANGPCFGALPVYNSDRDKFWEKIKMSAFLEGYHSVAIVGWNDKGFIIRNSWGPSYGRDGYMTVPYSEFRSFKEIWTIMA